MQSRKEPVRLVVYDKDSADDDDPIGQVLIPWSATVLPPDTLADEWYALQPMGAGRGPNVPPNQLGRIRLRIMFTAFDQVRHPSRLVSLTACSSMIRSLTGCSSCTTYRCTPVADEPNHSWGCGHSDLSKTAVLESCRPPPRGHQRSQIYHQCRSFCAALDARSSAIPFPARILQNHAAPGEHLFVLLRDSRCLCGVDGGAGAGEQSGPWHRARPRSCDCTGRLGRRRGRGRGGGVAGQEEARWEARLGHAEEEGGI